MKKNPIVIIDFGSQYTMLIARKIRELNVFCEIVHTDFTKEEYDSKQAVGVILSGSPDSVSNNNFDSLKWIWEIKEPILGICFGMQWMADCFGGKVKESDNKEFGSTEVCLTDSDLFSKQDKSTVWMSHGEKIVSLPSEFKKIGFSSDCEFVAIEHTKKRIFGLQFHPEVTHTNNGKEILNNFVVSICGASQDWEAKNIAEDIIANVRKKVGDDRVLLALSGGVDSSVVAALLHKAIGDKLLCVFIDNGLLRLNEREQVKELFADNFSINLEVVDARDVFLTALKGETDPETKRKIVGRCFIEEFDKFVKNNASNIKWLAQGTIYPDVVESSANKAGNSTVIKSHHNVGGIPKDMPFELIEPIRMLFKDEVRRLGSQLGLPDLVVKRHPFPGPGLSVRILGEVKPEYCEILQKADNIFIQELLENDLYHSSSQAFVVFMPVKTVGVVGDNRAYGYTVALRSVCTVDFMTATITRLPYDLLEKVSGRIINEIEEVARVVYDISSKPPATIEWE
jgi:GMP synthase (glutamine-hydrolysing)